MFGWLFPQVVFGQGWEWQNPLPQGNDLNIVQFVDNQNGWIVPVTSRLFRTNNDGQTWETLQLDVFLRDVYFVTPEIGWAIARKDLRDTFFNVYHTQDGGQTWELQLDENVDPGLFFLDSTTGWVPACQFMHHTPDGGKTWVKQAEIHWPWGGTCLDGVFFRDPLHGWAFALSWGIKTIDGGQSWESDPELKGGRKMVFADSSQGWLMTPGTVIRTVDGGQTWETIYTFTPENKDNDIEDLVVFNRNELLISTGEGVYASSDSGFTWEKLTEQPLGSVAFLDNSNAWAVGSNERHDPAMYQTIDGGRTWQTDLKSIVPTKTAFFVDVDFVNDQVGWVIGNTGRLGPQYMFKTVDGGATWFELQVPGNRGLGAIQFLDENLGWVGGSSGTVFHTTDGGATWLDRSIGRTVGFREVVFLDPLNGWFVGGSIWKTNDGGENWVDVSLDGINFATAGAFVDTLHGWVVTGGNRAPEVGSIWHTSDGGRSWQQQISDDPLLDFDGVAFSDTNIGWAIGVDATQGFIYATQDGGQNWFIQQTFINSVPVDISVFDKMNASVIGLGNVVSTHDGGQTWTSEINPTFNFLTAIDLIDGNAGWIVGTRSTILHKKSDNPSSIEERVEPEAGPRTFRLLQNYPNPFAAETQISFDLIQSPGQIILTIYDILGKTVRTITYFATNTGQHHIMWDGRDTFGNRSASGVYLYRLQMNHESQAGKLILTR